MLSSSHVCLQRADTEKLQEADQAMSKDQNASGKKVFGNDDPQAYYCCNLLLPSPPHVNKSHGLIYIYIYLLYIYGGNPNLKIHPARDRCQAQATARGASSGGKPDEAMPAYTDSSMDRFNRGGTQVDAGATPYYGSPFRAPMEPETPIPVPKENDTGAEEVETPYEPETPVAEVEPTQPDIPDEVSDGDKGGNDDKGECKEP